MDPFLAATLIGSGSTLLQGGINAGTSIINARESYKYNKKLAQFTNDLNMQNWREQAAYNSVGAQLSRLRAAGLNTNLIYGTGADGGQASAAPEVSNSPMEFNMIPPSIAGSMSAALPLQKVAADVAKTESQTELTKMQTLTEMYKAAVASKDADFAERIKEAQLALMKAQAAESESAGKLNSANIEKINADRSLTEIIAYYYPLLADNTLSLGESQRKEAESRMKVNDALVKEATAKIDVHKATANKLKAEIVKISYECGKLYTSASLDAAGVRKIAQDIKESNARIRKLGAEAGLTEAELEHYVFNTMKQGSVSFSLSDDGFSFQVPVWVSNIGDDIFKWLDPTKLGENLGIN